MTKKRSASCRLCGEDKELRRSHILSVFFRDDSASMYPTGKNGVPQPFTQPIHTHTGNRFARKQHGYWEQHHGMVEPLLCYDPEQKFSAFEDYAKRFFYGSSDPIRLSVPLLPEPVFTADYKKMKLFQLSILWCAAEATGEFFLRSSCRPIIGSDCATCTRTERIIYAIGGITSCSGLRT